MIAEKRKLDSFSHTTPQGCASQLTVKTECP